MFSLILLLTLKGFLSLDGDTNNYLLYIFLEHTCSSLSVLNKIYFFFFWQTDGMPVLKIISQYTDFYCKL